MFVQLNHSCFGKTTISNANAETEHNPAFHRSTFCLVMGLKWYLSGAHVHHSAAVSLVTQLFYQLGFKKKKQIKNTIHRKTSPSPSMQTKKYRAQLADLVLFLGFDVFPEYVSQQWALALVFQELVGLPRAGCPASLRPAVSGKRQSVSRGTKRQEWQRPNRRIPVMTKSAWSLFRSKAGRI